jgi:hypothetical protein
MKLVLSKGPKSVGVFLPSSEEGNKSSFRNILFRSFLEFRTTEKVQNLSNSENVAASTRSGRSLQPLKFSELFQNREAALKNVSVLLR